MEYFPNEIKLKDILQVENCEEILTLICKDTGIPMWGTIRIIFLRLIMGDLIYFASLIDRNTSLMGYSKWTKIRVIARSFLYNSRFLNKLDRQYPVLIKASGSRLINQDGVYFNCLSDYFVEALTDHTLAIEDLFDWKWPFPRKHNNFLIQTPLRVKGVIGGRLRAKYYQNDARILVNLIARRAKEILGWEIGKKRQEWLEKVCAQAAGSLLPRSQAYESILLRSGAKLLIIEAACYGGADNISALKAAKNLGIATAEYQHGGISSGYDAYNFSSAVINSSAYKDILPDYLLTFGQWWGEQVNVPIKKITIGNPNRSSIKSLNENVKINHVVLVLGDGISTVRYLEFCEQLSFFIKGLYQVVFRPHPLERLKIQKAYPSGLMGQVLIDTNQDIYDSFSGATVVISQVSTGLFEAVGIVPIILVWDTLVTRFTYPQHPFQRFTDVNELAKILQENNISIMTASNQENIWAPNWKSNYLKFISSIGI